MNIIYFLQGNKIHFLPQLNSKAIVALQTIAIHEFIKNNPDKNSIKFDDFKHLFLVDDAEDFIIISHILTHPSPIVSAMKINLNEKRIEKNDSILSVESNDALCLYLNSFMEELYVHYFFVFLFV